MNDKKILRENINLTMRYQDPTNLIVRKAKLKCWRFQQFRQEIQYTTLMLSLHESNENSKYRLVNIPQINLPFHQLNSTWYSSRISRTFAGTKRVNTPHELWICNAQSHEASNDILLYMIFRRKRWCNHIRWNTEQCKRHKLDI